MKRNVLLAALAIVAIASTVVAQEDEISVGLSRAVIQAERKAIVKTNLEIAPQQEKDFWKAYWEYRGEMAKQGDTMVELISEYADAEGVLTDQQAEKMVQELLEIDRKKAQIKEKYIKKLRPVLLPKQLAKFYQIENKLDAIIMHDLATQIPLVR